MLHRMVLMARSQVDLGSGSLNGDLGLILSHCMKTSIEHSLTGALVWDSGHFFEVLEGDRDALRRFYERVATDPRIGDVQLLEFLPLAHRSYRTWAVGTRGRGQHDPALQRDILAGHVTAAQVQALVQTIVGLGPLAESPDLVCAA